MKNGGFYSEIQAPIPPRITTVLEPRLIRLCDIEQAAQALATLIIDVKTILGDGNPDACDIPIVIAPEDYNTFLAAVLGKPV